MFSVLKGFNISEKGEYETTDAFHKRVEAVRQSRRSDFERDYIFLLTNEILYRQDKQKFGDEHITYDADAAELSIDMQPGPITLPYREGSPLPYSRNARSFYWYKLTETVTPLGTYRGSYAFGATVTIQKKNIHCRCVAFEHEFIRDQTLRLRVDAMNERRKNAIAVAVVGKLAPPYTIEEDSVLEPTVQFPNELTYHGECVVLAPTDLWVYDTTTGTILHKFAFGETFR